MTTRQIANNLLVQALLLFVLYAAAALISAVKFLGSDSLVYSLPYHQVSAFSHVLMSLAITSGLLGSGLYIATSENASSSPLLTWIYRGWTLLLVLAFLAGSFGLLEGRHMLELPKLLDIFQVILVATFVVVIFIILPSRSPLMVIWMVGIIASVISIIIGLLPVSNAIQGGLLDGLAVGLNINIAYPLAAVAIIFWLIREQISENQIYSLAGLTTVAGAFLTLSSLNSLNPDELSLLLSTISAILAPLAYVILAVYTYRHANQWQKLGILLFLFNGILSGLQSLPTINQWSQGTRFTDLQSTLAAWAIIAIMFAIMQQLSEREGKWNSVSFWTLAIGFAIGGVALGSAGLVQTYLERILSVGYLETQGYMIPLYIFWVVGLLIAALGIALYAVRHFFNRA
jgi:nitric oxide reductase subunit B